MSLILDLMCVLDNPVMTEDAKGAESLHNIDHLVRPTHVWAKNKTGDSFTLRNHLAYGDTSGLTLQLPRLFYDFDFAISEHIDK